MEHGKKLTTGEILEHFEKIDLAGFKILHVIESSGDINFQD